MAPLQTRKRKSDALEDAPNTPTGSPAAKKMRITQGQKQALIDNLQLEITERARHLRAHYALQCADLRSRIERRINRVPISMRKMTMGELLAKHSESSGLKNNATLQTSKHAPGKAVAEERPLPAVPQATKLASQVRQQPIFSQSQRIRKRKSSEIHIASDPENEVEQSNAEHNNVVESLPVQKNKKRGRPAANNGKGAASRNQKTNNPGGVLSPRSHNSRTLPRSPIKDMQSPSKEKPSYIARPISPSKPGSPLKSAATAATSALSAAAYGIAKRGVAAGARLTRPGSRDKDHPVLPQQSPDGKMLPPPRPIAMSSPQRTASQSSTYTVNSEQSATSSAGTVVTKTTKRAAATAKTKATKTNAATMTAAAAKKTNTVAKAAGAVKRAATTKKDTMASKKAMALATESVSETATTGRVLRKRN